MKHVAVGGLHDRVGPRDCVIFVSYRDLQGWKKQGRDGGMG